MDKSLVHSVKVSTSVRDKPTGNRTSETWKTLKRLIIRPRATVALVVFGIFVVMAVATEQLATQDPTWVSLRERFLPPGASSQAGTHWLGTDHLGRDMLSRLMYGARISLGVGCGAVLLGAALGTGLGTVAGFVGGWWDSLIMRLVDVQLAVPMLLIAIGWAAFFRTSILSVTIIIALWGWAKYARISRGAVLILRDQEFVVAARALGNTKRQLMLRHVLPNLRPIIMVIATLEAGRAILLESTLSFLGLGLQPPAISWGLLLNDAKNYMEIAWWTAVFPGLAIALFVLSVNILGDALRDVLDPRLRQTGV